MQPQTLSAFKTLSPSGAFFFDKPLSAKNVDQNVDKTFSNSSLTNKLEYLSLPSFYRLDTIWE